MKPYGPLLLVFSLIAADVWEKKPFTDWSPKDVQHVLTSSPWARETAAAPSGGPGGGTGGGGGRGGGRGAGRGGGGAGADMDASMGGGTGGPGGGGMSGGGGAPGGGGGGAPSAAPQTMVLVRWQSALPVKQALLRGKFGSEVSTAAEAKAVLAREEDFYVVAVERLPRMGMGRPGAEGKSGAGDPERMRQMLARSTSLLRKGKEPIKPDDVKMATLEKTMTVYFIFPRTEAITLEDKEVEFSTKLGPLEIKRKFKLQDLVFAGKLAL